MRIMIQMQAFGFIKQNDMLIDFRQLFPRYNIKPKGVLHVGANVGEEAPVYDELGIEKVIWIEANETIFKTLLNNIEGRASHSALCYCVGDEHGKPVVFHISNNSGQSSSILELGTHKTAHPEVHFVQDIQMVMKRIDVLFDGNMPNDLDFLNIDLQGAELKALRGMGDLLHQFKWAYLEVNKEELYKGCALVEDIDMYMLGFGFRRAETKWCGNTGWGDALYIKGK
jgi:FkbM family methyltransferase